MKAFAFAAWLTIIAVPAAHAQAPSPKPCAGTPHAQFDFWLGDWEVVTADGKVAGSNRIEKTLGGCVLEENWTGSGGSRGRSFNIYFAGDRKWHQSWVDNSGLLLQLEGGLEDGKMVLEGRTPAAVGSGSVLQRITWSPLEGGLVRQHWQSSADQGKSWKDVFLGTYRRRGGAS